MTNCARNKISTKKTAALDMSFMDFIASSYSLVTRSQSVSMAVLMSSTASKITYVPIAANIGSIASELAIIIGNNTTPMTKSALNDLSDSAEIRPAIEFFRFFFKFNN